MVCATGEKDTLVSTLFSASFVVRDAAFRLPLAGMSSWCVAVVFGFTYSPVNPLLLLTGHGIGICSRSSFKEEFIVTELFHRINATL